MTIIEPLRAWLEARQPNAFLTFNFGYPVRQLEGERQIKHFFNSLQSEAYGRNWARRTADDRIEAVGAWEHVERWSNPHCHVSANVPELLMRNLERRGVGLWLQVSPRGQLDVSRTRRADKVVQYSTKDMHRAEDLDRLFVYGAGPERRIDR